MGSGGSVTIYVTFGGFLIVFVPEVPSVHLPWLRSPVLLPRRNQVSAENNGVFPLAHGPVSGQ